MAPKKKKKAANNPARGFATVSQPSKSKLAEVHETEPGSRADVTTKDAASDVQLVGTKNEPTPGFLGLQDMNAEQLEEHLEDAELQSILDTHGERAKRTAARQATRLEAERRLQRGQADDLDMSDMLHDDLVQQIIEIANSEGFMKMNNTRTPQDSGTKIPTDTTDLCVKLWTLQQTLQALGITDVEDALEYVVKKQQATQYTGLATSRDDIWGLEDSFDWLASHVPLENLPEYSPPKGIVFERSSAEYGEDVAETERPQEESHLPSTDNEDQSSMSATNGRQYRDKPQPTSGSSIDPSPAMTPDESEDDGDIDPDHLVAKYVAAKSALLRAEHEHRLGQQFSLPELASKVSAAKLYRTVHRIERDVLFDREEADIAWSQEWKNVHQNLPRPSRRSNQTNEQANTEPATNSTTSSPPKYVGRHVSQPADDDEEDNIMGGMFDTPLQNQPQDNTRQGQAVTCAMQLIDFGKWTGVSPRRVLEEACRARDSASRVSYQQLSGTSYSDRSRAHIDWSKPQRYDPVAISVLPLTLSCKFAPRFITISMSSIATSTPEQSEAYVSTIAFFAIFSGVAKEEKASLRLPDIWRDLFKDLTAQKQLKIDQEDRTTLRLVRSIVEKRPPPEGTRTLDVESARIRERGEKTHLAHIPRSIKAGSSPEQFATIWAARASTLAYQRMLETRSQLPIWSYKERIVDFVEARQITILCAETGAGKSTQVPTYILQSELSAGRDCRIFVTQPRRISAMSLARRVSAELGEGKNDIGSFRSLVGYAIRLESKTSSATRVTYATTGVLLRTLESFRNLEGLSHLILDEVHERTMDLDLLFIAIRRLVRRRADLKIVLMSATVDAQKFSAYFEGAPILNIPGRTYPVVVKYLEDAIEATNAFASSENRRSTIIGDEDEDTTDFDTTQKTKSVTNGLESYSAKTRNALTELDEYRIDYGLITNLAAIVATDKQYQAYSRAILIFMPGIAEIQRLHQAIGAHSTFIHGWYVHLLHSSFSSEDLERAFIPPPKGMRKIVIATNIAETGITIPDVTAVIDTCKEKTMRFDERRQLAKLTESFISRSSCRQRRGRAARVQDGLCFHLVTRYRYENLMPEHHIPEMLRLSLQEPVLCVKVWDLGEIEQTLAEALDPPSSKNVRRAIEAMKDVKALTPSEDLTPLGRRLARLPLDIWLGKLIILGISFQCLDAAVTIAALLSSKSLFSVSRDRHDPRAEAARLSFARGNSDLLLMYNAYLAWRRMSVAGGEFDFCKKNYLNVQALSQVEEQKIQLLVSLGDAGLLDLDEADKQTLRRAHYGRTPDSFYSIPTKYCANDNNDVAITSLIAMAFYPKLLLREGKGWRNVFTNQHVSLAPTSINKILPNGSKPPKWLSFHQAMQSKSRNPNAFETSIVSEAAIVILLGEADFRLYAGVILVDGSKIRFRVKNWKIMIALKILRARVHVLLAHSSRYPKRPFTDEQARWFGIWHCVMNARNEGETIALTMR